MAMADRQFPLHHALAYRRDLLSDLDRAVLQARVTLGTVQRQFRALQLLRQSLLARARHQVAQGEDVTAMRERLQDVWLQMMALRDRLQWCEAQLEECEQKRASTADHVRDLEFARDKRRDLWARPRTVLIDGEVMTLQQTATA